MPEQIVRKQNLEASLNRIRKRLLDLTRRNPLLNYRFPKASISVVDELPSPTFHSLLTGQSFTLSALDESEEEKESANRRLLSAREGESATVASPEFFSRIPQELPLPGEIIDPKHLDALLQTPFNRKELERRCKTLHTAARTALDETGANFLYVAIGFLEWFESEDSSDKLCSPLTLVPIEITKGKYDPRTDTFQYAINYIEEDIETNLSLAEKLFQDFHVELPEFDAESDPEHYFAILSERILPYHRWRVAREMVIGLFSFSKILMYQELDHNR